MNRNYKTQTRRDFLKTGAAVTLSGLVFPTIFAQQNSETDKKVRIAVVGGRFGLCFYWHLHPNCTVTAVTDLREDRRKALKDTFSCDNVFPSLEVMLKEAPHSFDAVAIFTGVPDHVKHAVMCLDAGKHVISAVPVTNNIEECELLLDKVRKTGLKYMMAETSYYHPATIAARQWFKDGLFGDLYYTEAEYHHAGMEFVLWKNPDGTPTWRHGLPPMLYPTHCTSFLTGVTGERLTDVSCIGWTDKDPILEGNLYGNPFWNETAFFKTDKGHALRVGIFWRGAFGGCERAQWYGDKMSFFKPDANGGEHIIRRNQHEMGKDQAGFAQQLAEREEWTPPNYAAEMLPKSLEPGFGKYHEGAEVFLVHEFIEAIVQDRDPAIDIYEALAYTVPGIIAHQSALNNGEQMKIPQHLFHRNR